MVNSNYSFQIVKFPELFAHHFKMEAFPMDRELRRSLSYLVITEQLLFQILLCDVLSVPCFSQR